MDGWSEWVTGTQLVAFSLYAILENASKWGLAESSLEIRDQEEQKEGQMPGYSQRTLLVKDQFHQGTAAVRIQNIQASDSGIYICHFKMGQFHEEAILELKVAGWLTDPCSKNLG